MTATETPSKAQPRGPISIAVSADERELIDSAVAKSGERSVAAFVRNAALEAARATLAAA